MIHLMHRGYLPGGGMLSPDKKTFVLNIPKNASTYVTNVLSANGWDYSDVSRVVNELDHPVKCVILLRDPIERWVSGFATYCCSYVLGYAYGSEYFVRDYNELSERLIFDNLKFDDHTEPQVTFVNQLHGQFQKEYLLIDSNREQLIKNISDITGIQLIIPQVNANASEDNYDAKTISKFMHSRLTPELRAKIVIGYHQDYELLKQVLSYEPR